MVIDHIGLGVSDYEKSKRFFSMALAPLGIEIVQEVQGWAGMGKSGKPDFWFGQHTFPHGPMHIAFVAGRQDETAC